MIDRSAVEFVACETSASRSTYVQTHGYVNSEGD